MFVGARVRIRIAAFTSVLATALALTASGGAAPSATLTVQLVPGAVSAGQPALAVVSFKNTGASTLTNVVVTLRFPSTLTDIKAPACPGSRKSANVVACSFGDVGSGGTARALVSVMVVRHLTSARKINVAFSLRVGNGRPQPIFTSASAKVLASNDHAWRGSCRKLPQTLVATLDAQTTELPSPPVADPSLRLPCTPLSVSVAPKPASGGYHTNYASVDLPKLKRPAIVKLTFANETLPDEAMIDNLPPNARPSFDNPNPLWRVDLKDPSKKYVVPRCKPGPTFPQGWRSCIISVVASDTNGDFDQGTITLLVQGAGFGDPRYIG